VWKARFAFQLEIHRHGGHPSRDQAART
jgi:hypothetical protein